MLNTLYDSATIQQQGTATLRGDALPWRVMATPYPVLYHDPLPVTLVGGVSARVMHNPSITALTLVTTGTTVLYGGFVSNPSTTALAYLQCFDAASTAAVTLGTTVPTEVLHIPPQSVFTDKWATVTVPYVNGLVIAATTDINNATLVTAATALKASLYFL